MGRKYGLDFTPAGGVGYLPRIDEDGEWVWIDLPKVTKLGDDGRHKVTATKYAYGPGYEPKSRRTEKVEKAAFWTGSFARTATLDDICSGIYRHTGSVPAKPDE